jgi:hypothetical protein
MRKIIYLPFLVMVMLCSCSQQDDNLKLDIPENAIAMEKGEGDLELVKDFTTLRQKLIYNMVEKREVFKGLSISSNEVEMLNFNLKKTSNERAYIIYTLRAKGEAVSVAHEMRKGENGFYTTNGISHECNGNPCSSCSFVEGSNGEITGCQCNTLGGHCNHKIVSNPGIDPDL